MIKVIAKHIAKEGKAQEILKIAKELVQATRQEEGCIKYEMYQDVKDENILTMLEEWESKECLEKHMATEHFKRSVPMIGELLQEPGEVNIYTKVL